MKQFIQLTLLCVLGAFITSIAFVITLTLTLPESDGAYGQLPFQDPIVFSVMSIFVLISGIIVTPFIYFTLRNRNKKRCACLILPAVLICVITLTPIGPGLGLISAFASLVLSTILCMLLGIGKNDLKTTEAYLQ